MYWDRWREHHPVLFEYEDELRLRGEEAHERGIFITLRRIPKLDARCSAAFEEFQFEVCDKTRRSTPYMRLLKTDRWKSIAIADTRSTGHARQRYRGPL